MIDLAFQTNDEEIKETARRSLRGPIPLHLSTHSSSFQRDSSSTVLTYSRTRALMPLGGHSLCWGSRRACAKLPLPSATGTPRASPSWMEESSSLSAVETHSA